MSKIYTVTRTIIVTQEIEIDDVECYEDENGDCQV